MAALLAWIRLASAGPAAHVICHGTRDGTKRRNRDMGSDLALCLLFLQVGPGLILKSGPSHQRQVRPWHFWSMVAFIGLMLAHLLKNA